MDQALAALCEQVRAATASRQPLQIRGGDSKAFYGNPWPEAGAAGRLDMATYRGIVRHEPSELVLTARAGTPLGEVEDALSRSSQMLAFEPPSLGRAGTFGGCIAAGLAGPRRMATGRLADSVLGVRLLSSAGHVLHFGGEVMKNVAGFDIPRLLAGSLGILGPILEISVKVIPKPRFEITTVLELEEADALRRCLGWRAAPIPVSATAWMMGDHGPGRLSVRLSGNVSAVREGLAKIGGEVMQVTEADRFWASIRNQTHGFFRQRPLWRLSLPPRTPTLGVGPVLAEWGGGLRWLAAPHDANELRARLESLGGSACLYRRDGASAPAFHPLKAAVLAIHRRLKHEFDPAGIFNPGRLTPEL